MTTTDTEYDLQLALFLLEALCYLALAGWCLGRRREGWWAPVCGFGALLLGLATGLIAALGAELKYLDSSHVADWYITVDHLDTALAVAHGLGALLLLTAVVQSRRTPPQPRSIYGPE